LFNTADSGLYFSARDLTALLRGLEKSPVLSKASTQALFTPILHTKGRSAFHGYSLGFQNTDIHGYRITWHGGTWSGFRAMIMRYPSLGFSVAVLANQETANVGRIARALVGMLEPKVAPAKAMPDKHPALTATDFQVLL
jgi:CubicO group peptidase (beta-lactamase class C family)